jgi:2-phospho-L-lactate transferase/gluconeogenesis factor (CofD/UPF0052 family)
MTGIISALLTRGIQTAIRISKARKVQVVNIMTQPGQTDGMSARDHIEQLSIYLGTSPDLLANPKRRVEYRSHRNHAEQTMTRHGAVRPTSSDTRRMPFPSTASRAAAGSLANASRHGADTTRTRRPLPSRIFFAPTAT